MNSHEILYSVTEDPTALLASGEIKHLAGKYLTPDRLGHAAFAITAHADGFIGGVIIGELPWGRVGVKWDKHIPEAIEIGALLVDPSWRGTPVAFRLMNLALSAAARSGRVPVAVTEVGSPVHRYLERTGAQGRSPFVFGGTNYMPWVLMPNQEESAAA